MMDLKADLRAHILSILPHDRADSAVVSDLASKPIDTLLVIYHNWLSRLVRPAKRSVHLSREFASNPLRTKHSAGLNDTLAAVENGIDLTSRLSKLVINGYIANSSSKTKDKDLMLNDWSVHHLHLGTKPDANDPAYIQRTGKLLFVIFRPTAACVLDIFDHAAWTDRDIVRIAVGNWPGLDFFLEMKGVVGVAANFDEKEHQKLRRAGITSAVEIDGRVYVGRGMLSTAGTSYQSARAADVLLDRIEEFERLAVDEPLRVKKLLRDAGVNPPDSPDFEFVFLTDGYGIREKTTGGLIVLSLP